MGRKPQPGKVIWFRVLNAEEERLYRLFHEEMTMKRRLNRHQRKLNIIENIPEPAAQPGPDFGILDGPHPVPRLSGFPQ